MAVDGLLPASGGGGPAFGGGELDPRSDVFSLVDMSIQVQVERHRVLDAIKARDAAVHRLNDAYTSLNNKKKLIDWLLQELNHRNVKESDLLKRIPSPAQQQNENEKEQPEQEEIARLNAVVKSLQGEIRVLKEKAEENTALPLLPPPIYEPPASPQHLDRPRSRTPTRHGSLSPSPPEPSATSPHESAEILIAERNKILAVLSVPTDYPDESLDPILIPTTVNFHDLLNSTYGFNRSCLANYRVLQEFTTHWCPEREEHGYFLTPVFKCTTNPRVITAHRWMQLDVMARLGKPIECFYYKDGKYYYAGTYKAFRLNDLTTKEWEQLSTETINQIIKDTISSRKNTSPQNIYEITQLYAAGALKIACVGIQCVGFNMGMYRSILGAGAQACWKAQSSQAQGQGPQEGVLKLPPPPPPPSAVGGRGVLQPSVAFNANAQVSVSSLVDGLGRLGIVGGHGVGAGVGVIGGGSPKTMKH